jgi:hypothetical protein
VFLNEPQSNISQQVIPLVPPVNCIQKPKALLVPAVNCIQNPKIIVPPVTSHVPQWTSSKNFPNKFFLRIFQWISFQIVPIPSGFTHNHQNSPVKTPLVSLPSNISYHLSFHQRQTGDDHFLSFIVSPGFSWQRSYNLSFHQDPPGDDLILSFIVSPGSTWRRSYHLSFH